MNANEREFFQRKDAENAEYRKEKPLRTFAPSATLRLNFVNRVEY